MCPPRKSKKEKVEKAPKEPAKKVKEEPPPPVKIEFTPGVGWTVDNYAFLKTLPNEEILDKIYEMFGIPLSYKIDKTKSAIQVFVEFHQSSFIFAQQFVDTTKALSIIAILSDYISSVPAFTSAKDSFSSWIEKATKQIQSLDFTQTEQDAIISYLNKNIRQNAHILSFVLTKEAVEKAEQEGIKLFRTVVIESAGKSEEDLLLEAQKRSELEQQQYLLEKAKREKIEQEERQKQEEIAKAIQEMMVENFQRIQETLEKRNDALVAKLLEIEASIDAAAKNKKRE